MVLCQLPAAKRDGMTMDDDAERNNAERTRGRPFEPGNAGRPKGSRNKATLAAEALLDGEAETLTRRAIQSAMDGDGTALRLCLERILPPRRSRPVEIELPRLTSISDALEAHSRIAGSVSAGDLTPDEAADVGKVIDNFTRAFETNELEARIVALEEAAARK